MSSRNACGVSLKAKGFNGDAVVDSRLRPTRVKQRSDNRRRAAKSDKPTTTTTASLPFFAQTNEGESSLGELEKQRQT